nr:ribonuclease H domain-containing protein [Tanacetum cinerariifolium]
MKLPECPHEGCKSRLDINSCMKFLTLKSYKIMILREKEASIPPAKKKKEMASDNNSATEYAERTTSDSK